MTAFVLGLLALLAGPVVWALSWPLVQTPPVVLAVLAVVMCLVGLPLALLARGRVKRGQADARGLTLAGLVLTAAVPLVLVVQGIGTGMSLSSDAVSLCSDLAGQYQIEVTADAVSRATPGVGWRTQIDRARLMTQQQCPDATALISSAERFLTRGY